MRFLYFLLLLFLLATCLPKSATNKPAPPALTRFLVFQTPALKEINAPPATGKINYRVIYTQEVRYMQEDSLRNLNGLLLPFSVLHQLNPKNLTSLQRYLEAGGRIITVKDSAQTPAGWPWLSAWNNLPLREEVKAGPGKIWVLPPDYTPTDMQNAITGILAESRLPDFAKATTWPVPDSSRFTYQILSQGMDEPMQMAILPDNNVLLIERKGSVKLYQATTQQTKVIANFEVFSGIEDGLLGVALDPNFVRNNWIYFYYAVPGSKAVNRLARLELRGDNLLRESEKVLLEIPTQRQYCCHSAGYLQFGPDSLLYLATGDNTNAEETEGYIPIDERPGRQLADDQATAANTNDLRGKILRLKPEPDGTYSIPAGNLFPKGTPKTRPEIYTMGHRNPYRFSIDRKNNFIYWGDIGPDTKVPASEGTLSYDEVNQARKPGFFGWPYFLGNNEAFPYYDYATKKPRSAIFNPLRPVNNSPNNTGIRELPPAQPAMIWYGDGFSKKFPWVGKGGQTVLAGPVYYADLFPGAKYKLPAYYNGKLLIYDWIRRWVMAVTFDENKNYLRMEPFLDHIPLAAPTDLQFAPDGALYILEYGTNWFAKNADARLIRVEYAEGNRKPVARIQVDRLFGAVPLAVNLSAAGSKDFDATDSLTYQWKIDGRQLTGKKVTHTFTQAGTHEIQLQVTDNRGESSAAMVPVKAGNAPPVVSIATTANRSFYWDNGSFDYQVHVSDAEDKIIDPQKVKITWNFLPRGKDVAMALTNPAGTADLQHLKGQYLLTTLDCKACHAVEQASVGPAYVAVAARYAGQPGAIDKLSQKIIKGGSGAWGQRTMSAHPDLPVADAQEIVNYILSLREKKQALAPKGRLNLQQHPGKGSEGSYLLTAQYTDQGANGIEALTSRDAIVLRNPLVQVEDYDEGTVKLGTVTTEFLTYATNILTGSFVQFNNLDLTHVRQLKYRVQPNGRGGQIEVRLGGPTGRLVSKAAVPDSAAAGGSLKWREITAPLAPTTGQQQLYFIFTNPGQPQQPLFNLDYIYFANK